MTDLSSSAVPNEHIRQRQRIPKACDECRRRKIKCNGNGTIPCRHCMGFGLECAYQLQRKSRKRGPAKTDDLARRVQGLENLLRTYVSTPVGAHSDATAMILDWQKDAQHGTQGTDEATTSTTAPESAYGGTTENAETMMATSGELAVDNEGKWDYYGRSSELAFLQQLESIFGPRTDARGRKPPYININVPIPRLFESGPPPDVLTPRIMLLPTRQIIDELVGSALDGACALGSFVDRVDFDQALTRIYTIHPSNYGLEERGFLPLLYATLALGCLFTPRILNRLGYERAIVEGSKYFDAARQMIDIADCRDITSLQALIILNMFLQCTARLSRCYSYIGVTTTLALRMGLHCSLSAGLNPAETEARRRTFWSIRNMEARISSLLGLPRLLHEDDIGQEIPADISDDVCLSLSSSVSCAYTSLTRIMAKIVKHVYPTKQTKDASSTFARYVVSYASMRKMEYELDEWKLKLPPDLITDALSASTSRPCLLLRIYYGHIRLMLYRPFLHYFSKAAVEKADLRAQKFAETCIDISRDIIRIAVEMNRRDLLTGAYWFEFYTVFSAVTALFFPILDSAHDLDVSEMLTDAKAGRDVLMHLAPKSMAANRCTQMLKAIFQRAADDKDKGEERCKAPSEGNDLRRTSLSLLPEKPRRPAADNNLDAELQFQKMPNVATAASIAPAWTDGSLPNPPITQTTNEPMTQDAPSGPWFNFDAGSQDESSPSDLLRIQQYSALSPYMISLPHLAPNIQQQPQDFAGFGSGLGNDWFGGDAFPNDVNIVDMLNVGQWNPGGPRDEGNLQW